MTSNIRLCGLSRPLAIGYNCASISSMFQFIYWIKIVVFEFGLDKYLYRLCQQISAIECPQGLMWVFVKAIARKINSKGSKFKIDKLMKFWRIIFDRKCSRYCNTHFLPLWGNGLFCNNRDLRGQEKGQLFYYCSHKFPRRENWRE